MARLAIVVMISNADAHVVAAYVMRHGRPGARFSKVPKSFRARKATTKISNLKFTELFFSHIFNMNKFSLHAKFHAYTLLCF